MYCTTSSSSSCSTRQQSERFRQRETGDVPGRGGGGIGGKNITGSPNGHGRKRGTFLGTVWCTLPEGRPTTGRPATKRPGCTTGRPGWMGSTEWCRTRGSRTGKSCRNGRRVQADVLGRPGWMGSTGWCRTRGSTTGKSCRSGRRVQSDVPSLPTVALWNRRTMGSTGSPKKSTTEP